MSVKVYRVAVTVLLAVVATMAGVMMTHHRTGPAGPSQVSSFNDGFADSKADDCQQGFASACAWLRAN